MLVEGAVRVMFSIVIKLFFVRDFLTFVKFVEFCD